MEKNEKLIWTFWEPKANIPPYIELCMRTWAKFLPDYEVIICDYKNLRDHLDDKVYNQIIFKKTSLAKQSDMIRAALLTKYGGIWLDTDTIITNREFIDKSKKSDVVMLGSKRPNSEKTFVYGAFVYAARAGTDFMNEWFRQLLPRIAKYKRLARFAFLHCIFKKQWKACENWDYCLNAFVDDMAVQYTPPHFLLIDRDDVSALPEFKSDLARKYSGAELYKKFYFNKGRADRILKQSGGIILLHNSWTPEEYRKMPAEAFLQQDIMIADLLRELLKVN